MYVCVCVCVDWTKLDSSHHRDRGLEKKELTRGGDKRKKTEREVVVRLEPKQQPCTPKHPVFVGLSWVGRRFLEFGKGGIVAKGKSLVVAWNPPTSPGTQLLRLIEEASNVEKGQG